MNRHKIFLIMLAIMTVALANGLDATTVRGFSRYEVILQRRPFGEAPPAKAESLADAHPVKAGPSPLDSFCLCAFTDGGGAVRVGFYDTKQKPIKTYFLFVGQSEDGIEVVSADYESESVVLRKDGYEREISMSGSSGFAAASTASKKRPSAHRSAGYQRRRTRITRTREDIEKARRLAIERKKPILQGDEYEEHIRQYNLNEIRMGDAGIPLPVPLSPEDDAMLVKEGVLAPVE